MNALVICFSKFGNTKTVAGTIAATLESRGSARVVSTDQLAAADVDGADLVGVGSQMHHINLPEAVRRLAAHVAVRAASQVYRSVPLDAALRRDCSASSMRPSL